MGVIIKDGKILLMHRLKDGQEYYVFPGGGVEEGETVEQSFVREMREELNLDINKYTKVFELDNQDRHEVYYLVTDFNGTVKVGGPEKERTTDSNQYQPEWVELPRAAGLKNLFPKEALDKLRRLPDTHPNPEYYKAVPKKRISSGVLLLNQRYEILILKPSYKDHWSVPGGMLENYESPREGAVREVSEEIGLKLGDLKFLCVEYTNKTEKKDDDIFFLFYGGKLTPAEIKDIKIDNDEISEYLFAKPEEVVKLFAKTGVLSKIILKAIKVLKDNEPVYLEDGE